MQIYILVKINILFYTKDFYSRHLTNWDRLYFITNGNRQRSLRHFLINKKWQTFYSRPIISTLFELVLFSCSTLFGWILRVMDLHTKLYKEAWFKIITGKEKNYKYRFIELCSPRWLSVKLTFRNGVPQRSHNCWPCVGPLRIQHPIYRVVDYLPAMAESHRWLSGVPSTQDYLLVRVLPWMDKTWAVSSEDTWDARKIW